MDQIPISMRCLVLLSFLLLAESFPSSGRGPPPDAAGLKYGGLIKVGTHEKVRSLEIQKLSDSETNLSFLGEVIEDIKLNMPSEILKNNELVGSNHVLDKSGGNSKTGTHLATGSVWKVNRTDTALHDFNRQLLNGDQKLIAKYNALLNSDLRGFRRETISVPEHRKSRQRRSFFLEYGITDDEDVVFSPHTSACDIADRRYCLNGGTCVFVSALDIKTCRCKIGYTGLRCEMINQEFLLALLANEFFG